ncbi:MAG: YHS domain-containing (seleno)protein [Planctomycetota bacterium]
MCRSAVAACGVLAAVGMLACAADPAGPTGPDGLPQNLSDGVALHGYDPVAYFPEGGRAPTPGSPQITAEWNGATYRFASQEHRELFEERPEKYAPAYHGYCAYAVADDALVDVDPESYLIQDGRLLLFYKDFFTDTRSLWGEEPDALRERADGHWAERARRAGASSGGSGGPATRPG